MSMKLKVDYHQSGIYTLTEKSVGDSMYRDCAGDLFMNNDKGRFYRAVAQKIADLQVSGHKVDYQDTSII